MLHMLRLTVGICLLGCGSSTPTDAGRLDGGGLDASPGDADAARTDADAGDGGSGPSLTPGDHEFTFVTPDGRTRKYLVHVPPVLDASAPLLLHLHGGGGSAQSTADATHMADTADANRFLLAFPEGIPNMPDADPARPLATWNSGDCCGPAAEESVDDVAYISMLLDDLAARQSYDQRRVYATGLSNGSMMSYRLACDLSERIAAIAPVAGHASGFTCTPTRPVSISHIHGTLDMCANYEGGTECGGCFERFLNNWLMTMIPVVTQPCNSVQSYIDEWRTRNTCVASSTITYSNGSATCETWECAAESTVSFCRVEGMGHTWPGGDRPGWCDDPTSRGCLAWIAEVGAQTTDIGNQQIWDSLASHSLP